jgi:stress response protein YsnF
VISKDARVVEEVSLNKEVTESEQTIIDTVRHTEVDQENIDPNHRDKHIL